MSSTAQATSAGEKVSIRPSSSASAFRSCAAIGRISMASRKSDFYDLLCQGRIVNASRGGTLGKARIGVEIAIWIHFNNIRLTVRVKTHIHPSIIPTIERFEGGDRHLDDARLS